MTNTKLVETFSILNGIKTQNEEALKLSLTISSVCTSEMPYYVDINCILNNINGWYALQPLSFSPLL